MPPVDSCVQIPAVVGRQGCLPDEGLGVQSESPWSVSPWACSVPSVQVGAQGGDRGVRGSVERLAAPQASGYKGLAHRAH